MRGLEIVWKHAKHPDIQKHQDVFRDTRLRTWQWLIGPVIPSERLEKALDAYAADRNVDMFETLYGGLDLKIPMLPRGPIRKLPKAITGK